jgi:hypothetical protein
MVPWLRENGFDSAVSGFISDSEDGQPIYFDNQDIDASNDQEAISKADKWAARHKLGVVAMLIVRQGVRDVHRGRFIWPPEQCSRFEFSLPAPRQARGCVPFIFA